MRCFAAFAMIPILILSSLGGTTLLAHAHDGHGIHFHIAPSPEEARLSAQQHRLLHAHDPHACDNSSNHHHEHDQPCDHAHDESRIAEFTLPSSHPDSNSLIITIPDQEALTLRGTHLVAFDIQAHLILLTTLLTWSLLTVSDVAASPGGTHFPAAPRHLCDLSTSQRLVRVNGALLL